MLHSKKLHILFHINLTNLYDRNIFKVKNCLSYASICLRFIIDQISSFQKIFFRNELHTSLLFYPSA